MRAPATFVVLLGALALSGAGCGSSGSGPTTGEGTGGAPPLSASAEECPSPGTTHDLKAFEVDCQGAAAVAREWLARAECAPSSGASRSSCALGSWRCLSVRASRGIAVSCAGKGRSIAFVARP